MMEMIFENAKNVQKCIPVMANCFYWPKRMCKCDYPFLVSIS